MGSDPSGGGVEELAGRYLDGVETGHRCVDHHPDPARVLVIQAQPGVGDRPSGGSDRELGEAGRAAQALAGAMLVGRPAGPKALIDATPERRPSGRRASQAPSVRRRGLRRTS